MADETQSKAVATHRGVLAGLTEEQRQEKIRAAMMGQAGADLAAMRIEAMEEQALDGQASTTLACQLESLTRDKLVEMAKDYDLKGYSKLKKPELAELIAQECGRHDDDLGLTLAFATQAAYDTARRLARSGGSLDLSDEEVGREPSLETMPPYVYAFRGEGAFTLVVPEELREGLARVDWDTVDAVRGRVAAAQHCAEVLTDLCGVVSLDDAWAQYRAWFGEAHDQESFERDVLSAVSMGDLAYGVWFDADDCYLVNYELDEAQVSPEDDKGAEELEGFKKYLLRLHKDRPMPNLAGELRDVDAIDYVLGQPSAVALRDFFDAHVPDDEDDLYYADRLMEGIADLNGNLVSFEETLRALDEADLGLTGQERAEMLPLLRAMLEDLPYWENRGWSNNQLRQAQGTRAFYDAQGQEMKVGRNDPCPCGSGLKFKRCCGR